MVEDHLISKEKDFIVSCCNFYENTLLHVLFGTSLHPGGLQLTKELGEKLNLSPKDKVLDLASGLGTTAMFLAEEFGVSIIGIDVSEKNVKDANSLAQKKGLGDRVKFMVANAEKLPFEDQSFDVIISECSFCLFQNKESASLEMNRLLNSGGRLGITDVAIEKKLPIDIEKMIFKVACISDALSMNGYRRVLEKGGFVISILEDRKNFVNKMIADIKKKIFFAEIAKGLNKIDLRGLDLEQAKYWLKRAKELINEGYGTYCLIIGFKPG